MSFPNFSFPILFPRISHAATNLLWLLFFFLFLPVETVHSPAKDGQKRKKRCENVHLILLENFTLPSFLIYAFPFPFLFAVASIPYGNRKYVLPLHLLPSSLPFVPTTPTTVYFAVCRFDPAPSAAYENCPELSVLKKKTSPTCFITNQFPAFIFFLPFLATAPSGSSSSDNSSNIAVAAGSNIFLCRTSILLYTHF